MNYERDMLARLRGDIPLAAVFGSRIAWFEAARSWGFDSPYMVLQEISPGRNYTHDGASGMHNPRVQFDMRAPVGGAAELEAGRAALLGVMERDGDVQGSTKFHFGTLIDSDQEVEDLGNDRKLLRLRQDYQFFWNAVI